MEKRIKNLHFRKAIYIGEEPEHPSYHIDKWYPNPHYKREKDYIKDGDYYKYKEPEYANCRIHKNCFKNRECCYAIGCFSYDKHEGYYEFSFVGNRPLELTDTERVTFWNLISYGFTVLNDEIYGD